MLLDDNIILVCIMGLVVCWSSASVSTKNNAKQRKDALLTAVNAKDGT